MMPSFSIAHALCEPRDGPRETLISHGRCSLLNSNKFCLIYEYAATAIEIIESENVNRVIMNFATDNFKLQFENYHALVC